MTILSVDIGTSAMKLGIFEQTEDELVLLHAFSQAYPINTYHDGLFSDIDPRKWQKAFIAGCRELKSDMADVAVIALSGTTPALTAMDQTGHPLYPAILMLDQRSRLQAQRIIDEIGIEKLLAVTGNMPVAGGCSLASILWIKDHYPDIFKKTACFGHSNTFMARWLTGGFAIDPSSASLTALYNTVANDRTWNEDIAGSFDIGIDRLPRVIRSADSPGQVRSALVSELGLSRETPVVIGGNDAVLAAYAAGVTGPGDIFNINGTCEITLVCLPECFPSKGYNVRSHVIDGRLLTLYVMNAEGVAFDWFAGLFCREMPAETFYNDFLPDAVEAWLHKDSGVTYTPFLMGSRYCQQPLKAGFSGLTPETTRKEILAALVRGLCEYQKIHLDEIAGKIPLSDTIRVSGGAVNPSLIRAKSKWMRNCDYQFEAQSSLKGAALLGLRYLESNR
jgi:sugar (pentulose or hexulose) kinase